MEERPGRFVSGKPVLFVLGLGPTTPYSLGILAWNFYQTFHIVSTEFWLRFEPQIRPIRFTIKFLFNTARVERKVRLCLKLFDFFPRWILIHLTLNLSRFVPNSVEILTWNFKKINILGEYFRNFLQTKAMFYQNSWNFRPTFCNFILGPYCAEKIHTSTIICCLHPCKEARP